MDDAELLRASKAWPVAEAIKLLARVGWRWATSATPDQIGFECRIDFGPGYRIYFGKDGDTLVILLGGGTKKRQSRDIETAKALWQEYRQRKR